MYIGINEFLLRNKSSFFNFSGSSMQPIQAPFKNTFVNSFVLLGFNSSKNKRPSFFSRGMYIFGSALVVIWAPIAIFLCKPILPPSGVSTGSTIPHWVVCKRRGPTTFALASSGKFNFLN